MTRSSLCRSQPANHRALRRCVRYRDVTSGCAGSKSPRRHPKVTFTSAASGKFTWQAGMSKRISYLRSYVPLNATAATLQAGKSEKYPQQAGMYKGMNSLAGYVARRDRDNWDF
jgi:hypothetical protein